MNDDYIYLSGHIPARGDTLRTEDGLPCVVYEDIKEDGTVVRFCHAVIDEDCTGWYLTSEDSGLICLIMAFSFEALSEEGTVKALKVVRKSKSGRSILCQAVGD